MNITNYHPSTLPPETAGRGSAGPDGDCLYRRHGSLCQWDWRDQQPEQFLPVGILDQF